MTLSSRHRIRNSSPGGLGPSTLPLGHGGSPQYWLSHVDGKETFLFLWNRRDREPNPNSGEKGSGANHYTRATAPHSLEMWMHYKMQFHEAQCDAISWIGRWLMITHSISSHKCKTTWISPSFLADCKFILLFHFDDGIYPQDAYSIFFAIIA